MTRVLGDALVRVRPDLTRFGSTLTKESAIAGGTSGSRFSAGFKSKLKIGVALTAAAAGVGAVKFLKGAVTEASTLGESMNAVNVTFGKQAAGIKKLGTQAADSVGLSKSEFNSLAVQFSSFADSIAGKGGNSVKVMKELTQRGADFASVMDLDVNEAMGIFQSGLAGESEPLRKYGIDLSAAAVESEAYASGIAKSGEKLTENQKVQARYSLLMKKTSKAQGDFKNTSDSLANSQRILGARWENLQAAAGKKALPALESISGWALKSGLPALEKLGGVVSDVGGNIRERLGDLGGDLDFGSWATQLRSTGTAVTDWAKGLIPTLSGVWDQVTAVVGPGLARISSMVTGDLLPAFRGILPVILPAAKFIIKFIGGAVVGALKGAIQFITGAVDVISGIFKTVKAVITGDWRGAWNGIKQIARGSLNAVIGAIKVWFNLGILSIFKRGIVALLKSWKGGWNRIKGIADIGRRLVQRAFTLLGAAARGLWTRAVRPAFAGIGNVVSFTLKRVVVPALRGLWTLLTRVVFPVIRFLWTRVVKPVFSGAGAAIRAWWNNIVKPVFNAVKSVLTRVVFPILRTLWNGVVKPVFSGMGKTIKGTWTNVIKPIFTQLRTFITDKVVPAFRRGVDGIEKIWKGLKEAAAAPVRFVVNTVYNNGIRKMVNAIPGVSNLPSLSFAQGGVMPGYTPGRDVHSFFSPTAGRLDLSGGEAFMRPEFTRRIGKAGVNLLNSASKHGKKALDNALTAVTGGTQHGAPRRRFFLGGVFPLQAGALTNNHGAGYYGSTFAGDLNGPLDLANPPALVKAWKAGTVAATNFWTGSYGRHVNINHGGQWSRYAHLSTIFARPGQKVGAGQSIGRVGSTGNSTGAHLHFEVHGGGVSGSTANSGGGSAKSKRESLLAKFKGAISAAKNFAGNIKGWFSKIGSMKGWGPMIKQMASSVVGKARSWVNDKIPGPGPIPSFDSGGHASGIGYMHKRTLRPERVLSPRQTESFDRLVALLEQQQNGDAGAVQLVVEDGEAFRAYVRRQSNRQIGRHQQSRDFRESLR